MEGGVVFCRANVESVRVLEVYDYKQTISRLREPPELAKSPTGRLEISVPYDGYRYFTRQAAQDIAKQRAGKSGAADEATIGYIVFANQSRTSLSEDVALNQHFGAQPIRVPIAGPELASSDSLQTDKLTCVITHEYSAQPFAITPVSITVEVGDEAMLAECDLDPDLQDFKRGNTTASQLFAGLVKKITQQVSFQRDLLLHMRVTLNLPANMVAQDTAPRIVRGSLQWPTMTSLNSLLILLLQPGESATTEDGSATSGSPSQIKDRRARYNPMTRSFSWRNVPFSAGQPPRAGSDLCTYTSGSILAWITQPGELFRQTTLDGLVEIEVPGQVASGLQFRVFDATGRLADAQATRASTHINLSFHVVLDDAFRRRLLYPHHLLYFDEVLPEDMLIGDIRLALSDRGFACVEDVQVAQSKDELKHLLLARRQEGPHNLDLWLLVSGKQYDAQRQTVVPGGQTFTSTVRSGELTIYLRGELPGNSLLLTQEMNALQTALRDRFESKRQKK